MLDGFSSEIGMSREPLHDHDGLRPGEHTREPLHGHSGLRQGGKTNEPLHGADDPLGHHMNEGGMPQ